VGRGERVGVGLTVAVDVRVGVSVSGSGVPVGSGALASLDKNVMERIKIRISDMPSRDSIGINDSLLGRSLSILLVCYGKA
jgi:hypothetical protein